MGLIDRIFNTGQVARDIGDAVGGVAEVFVGNQAEREAMAHETRGKALEQFASEFAQSPNGWFDRFVNGLNRLPRPALALGTLGLFVYAMIDPVAFTRRMEGLAYVPEPLWWLLGVIVSFYFGARELHHYRSKSSGRLMHIAAPIARTETRQEPAPATMTATIAPQGNPAPAPRQRPRHVPRSQIVVRAEDPSFNAAVEEWQTLR